LTWSSRAEPPAVFSQMPMSYRSGPDSIVALSVTAKGVVFVGSQVEGPLTTSSLLILTSLAVQDGLFNPVAFCRHALPDDCASAGVALAISPQPSRMKAKRTACACRVF